MSEQSDAAAERGLLSVGEVAKRLKLAQSTIYRAIKRGRIKSTKVGDRNYIALPDYLEYARNWEAGDENKA